MSLIGTLFVSAVIGMIMSTSAATAFPHPFASITEACKTPERSLAEIGSYLEGEGWSQVQETAQTTETLQRFAEPYFSAVFAAGGTTAGANSAIAYHADDLANLSTFSNDVARFYVRTDLSPPAYLLISGLNYGRIECTGSSQFQREEIWLTAFREVRGLRSEIFDITGPVRYAVKSPLMADPFGVVPSEKLVLGDVLRILPDRLPDGLSYVPINDVYIYVSADSLARN